MAEEITYAEIERLARAVKDLERQRLEALHQIEHLRARIRHSRRISNEEQLKRYRELTDFVAELQEAVRAIRRQAADARIKIRSQLLGLPGAIVQVPYDGTNLLVHLDLNQMDVVIKEDEPLCAEPVHVAEISSSTASGSPAASA